PVRAYQARHETDREARRLSVLVLELVLAQKRGAGRIPLDADVRVAERDLEALEVVEIALEGIALLGRHRRVERRDLSGLPRLECRSQVVEHRSHLLLTLVRRRLGPGDAARERREQAPGAPRLGGVRIHGAEEGALEELLALPTVLEGHVDLFPLELEIERDLLCSPVGEGIVEAVLDLLLDHASNAHSLADSKSERDGPDLLGTAEGRHHLRTDRETIDGEL